MTGGLDTLRGLTGGMGDHQRQIADAAKPSQTQAGETNKAGTSALNTAAQATSPNAGHAAEVASGRPSTPPPGGAGPATAGANTDPNIPR